jgi:hypothetical protein
MGKAKQHIIDKRNRLRHPKDGGIPIWQRGANRRKAQAKLRKQSEEAIAMKRRTLGAHDVLADVVVGVLRRSGWIVRRVEDFKKVSRADGRGITPQLNTTGTSTSHCKPDLIIRRRGENKWWICDVKTVGVPGATYTLKKVKSLKSRDVRRAYCNLVADARADGGKLKIGKEIEEGEWEIGGAIIGWFREGKLVGTGMMEGVIKENRGSILSDLKRAWLTRFGRLNDEIR